MRASTFLLAGLLLAGATAATAQSIVVEKPRCVPAEDNGLVRATVTSSGPASAGAGLSPRLYFRWREHEDFYWVALEPEAGGRFWATPPKPEMRNEQIELYGALVDATGKVVSRSESQFAPVTKDCKVELGPKERGVAQNLTVGETSPKQQGKKVLAFLCDGVVTRVNSAGVRRSDEVCRACVIAFWQRKAVLLAPVAGIIGVVVTDQDPEPSPSRP
jgi:hypothetical protein